MIGIINSEISAYSIIEIIYKTFPNISIYLYPFSNYEKGIELLREKNSKIIIIDKKDLSNFQNKYHDIIFLSTEEINDEKGYVLDDKELIKAIDTGNEKEVNNILNNLIIKEETIILNNPKLLFIKKIMEEKYKNKKIINSLELLVEKINVNINYLTETNNPIIKIITERK